MNLLENNGRFNKSKGQEQPVLTSINDEITSVFEEWFTDTRKTNDCAVVNLKVYKYCKQHKTTHQLLPFTFVSKWGDYQSY